MTSNSTSQRRVRAAIDRRCPQPTREGLQGDTVGEVGGAPLRARIPCLLVRARQLHVARLPPGRATSPTVSGRLREKARVTRQFAGVLSRLSPATLPRNRHLTARQPR